MIAPRLKPGDTIGIVSPSHVADPIQYAKIISGIQSKGFRIKTGNSLYRNTYGYLASEQERADDFHQMVLDSEVKMVFFGGGEGGNELLPFLDFDSIRDHPKIYLSYSDGTSILNAIFCKTGLITYYGQTPGDFEDLQHYTYSQFLSHVVKGDAKQLEKNSRWHTICPGICEGTLIGGCLENIALLVGGDYFQIDLEKKYILFLEDNEAFNGIDRVSKFLSHIEQSNLIDKVAGLLFGHYSTKIYPDLMERLKRFGEKHQVAVTYCDDFGHGENHAILPIGGEAILDTRENILRFN
jgi:muramoyltetrapeptide carboxypeptidase